MWFWLLGTIWAQDLRLGIFPMRTDALSKEERSVLQNELTQASAEHFQFAIISPQEIAETLTQITIPMQCAVGGCEVMLARMLGFHRFLHITVQARERNRIFRISLYDPHANLILLSNRIIQPIQDPMEGVAQKLIHSMSIENVVAIENIAVTEEITADMIDEYTEVETSIETVEAQGFESVVIPAGIWTDPEGMDYAMPSFLMMKSEVTQKLYEDVMEKKPSYFQRCGPDCPVDRISWYDALLFSNTLNEQSELPVCYEVSREGVVFDPECTGWRLPTDLEWLYAASGGLEKAFLYGSSNTVDENSWYRGNAGRQTHRSCEKKENLFGLCDMSGNVWEWVWDPVEGQNEYALRYLRGGSWGNKAEKNQINSRVSYRPTTRNYAIGFRLVRDTE